MAFWLHTHAGSSVQGPPTKLEKKHLFYKSGPVSPRQQNCGHGSRVTHVAGRVAPDRRRRGGGADEAEGDADCAHHSDSASMALWMSGWRPGGGEKGGAFRDVTPESRAAISFPRSPLSNFLSHASDYAAAHP